MSEKLTGWFSERKLPARKGIYEVDDQSETGGPWYSWWDGFRFGYRDNTPVKASMHRLWHTNCPQRTKWRGLTAEAK